MKVSAFLAALFACGVLTSLAIASPSKHEKPTTTTTDATTASTPKPKCNQVELKGTAMAGTFSFTVTKANKRGRDLVGTPVSLAVPVDAKVKAKACMAEGGALTLRALHVKVSPKP